MGCVHSEMSPGACSQFVPTRPTIQTARRIGGHGTDAVSCGSLNNIYAGSLKSRLLLKFIIDSWVLKRMQNVIGVSFYFLLPLTHLMSPTMTESM